LEMAEDLKTIRIDPDLYNQLRNYCDENGIRFLEFVEWALENAVHLDQVEDIINNEAKIMERIKKERKDSLRVGFRRGFCAALLTLQGKIELSLEHTPLEERSIATYKSITSGQLNLFE
jgi:hypothetical protein